MAADTDRQGPPARAAFARLVPLATRWSDNDAYGHLNNVIYYSLFDTAVNAILIEAGLLDPSSSPIIGLVVETSCRYYSSLTYPDLAEVGVAVEHLGRSSVRYHLAVFKAGARSPQRRAASPTSTSIARPIVRSQFRLDIGNAWKGWSSPDRPALADCAKSSMLASMTDGFPRTRDPDVFPAGVSRFSVTIPADAAEVPTVAGVELPPSLERAVTRRRIQFLAGRVCAREAIGRLAPGTSVGALPQDQDRCPVWPDGMVGSISHSARFATAAVVHASEARGLGVDVEPVMSIEAATDVAATIASEDETRRVAEAAGLDPLQILTLLFSAKESLFKALYPPTRRHFEFLDCELVRLDPEARGFALRFRPPFDVLFGAAEIAGRYDLAKGEVRTGVVVRPP